MVFKLKRNLKWSLCSLLPQPGNTTLKFCSSCRTLVKSTGWFQCWGGQMCFLHTYKLLNKLLKSKKNNERIRYFSLHVASSSTTGWVCLFAAARWTRLCDCVCWTFCAGSGRWSFNLKRWSMNLHMAKSTIVILQQTSHTKQSQFLHGQIKHSTWYSLCLSWVKMTFFTVTAGVTYSKLDMRVCECIQLCSMHSGCEWPAS